MHVAMVTPFPDDLDRPNSAIQVVAAPLVRSLVAMGVQVTILNWRSRADQPYQHPTLPCEVIPLRDHQPGHLTNWLISSRTVRSIVDKLNPDVVHVQGDVELGAALDCPRVLTVHGISWKDEWLLAGPRRYLTVPLLAYTFRKCSKTYKDVVLISPYSREAAVFHPDARLHDIFNPIYDCFYDVPRRPFTPIVLDIAHLSPLKNTMGALHVALRVRESIPDVRFRFAGKWTQTQPGFRHQVEAFCRDRQLYDTVDFLGFKFREELMEEMANAACLFLPSFQENAPLVIAESMAAGLPVAASKVGGIPWMVKEHETGLLFDPHQVDAMADALIALLSDPDRCALMGQTARTYAEKDFRADAVAAQTARVYERAIAG